MISSPQNIAIQIFKKSFLFFLLGSLSSYSFAQNQTYTTSKKDSLRDLLSSSNLSFRVNAYNQLSDILFQDSADVSYEYALRAYETARTLSNDESIALQAEKVGNLSTTLGKYETAIDYYTICLSLSKEQKNNLDISKFYRLIGIAYYYIGSMDKSLESHLESLQFAQKVNDKKSEAGAYNNIGLVYENSKKYELALENYIKAEQIFTKNNIEENLALCQINIGNIYYHNQDYDHALEYYFKSYAIFKSIDQPEKIALAAQNIALIYELKNNFVKAIEYSEISLNLYQKANDIRGIASLSNNLGHYYFTRNDFNKAEELFQNSLVHAKQTQSLTTLQRAYNSLYILYKEKQDYKNALLFLESTNSIVDSIYSLEIEKKVSELQSIFQLEQKEKEYKILRNSFIYITLLTLLIIVVLFYNYSIKLRSNRALKEKNIEIENQNIKLEKIIATRDKFFSIIAHDLKNPLSAFMGLTEVMSSSSSQLDSSTKLQLTKQLNKLAENMYNLLENLLNWGHSQTGDIEHNPSVFRVAEVVTETIDVLSVNASIKSIAIEKRIDETSEVFADKNMISTVIRNLLSNAIKFTEPGGKVEIYSTISDNKLTLLVKDNGVGISEKNLSQLFRIDSQFRTMGTSSEPGTGLGLILCKDFIERNYGTMIVESIEGKGSTFGFTVPIS
jgi:signal transduction histidine kinase